MRIRELLVSVLQFMLYGWCISFPVAGFSNSDSSVVRGFQPVTHYTRNDFKSHPRIYDMCEDGDGTLYFGNDEGVLVFDGESWRKVVLPNGSSVRSICIGSDGEVYVGAFSEFGIIQKDAQGDYYYKSLIELLRSEDRNTENVWSIHEAQGHIIFRAHKMVIALHGSKAVTFPASELFASSFVVNDELYVRDGDKINKIDFTTMDYRPVFSPADFGGETLLTILQGHDVNEYYGITREGTLYTLDLHNQKTTFNSRFLEKSSGDLVTCATVGSDGKLYIGTLRNKVLVTSLNRRPLEYQRIEDIQPNIVNEIIETRNGNIWVMLDAGIDCIAAGSPASILLEDLSVYDVTLYQHRLYVASNQGVHVSKRLDKIASITKNDFDIIPGLEGRGWSFQQFEGKLLCSHDKGVFELDGSSFRKIDGTPGIWKVVPIAEKPHYYFACAYKGIYLLHFEGGEFRLLRQLSGFDESSRDILQEEPGSYWICHGYKGVFHIKVDKEYERVIGVEHFTDENGLPSKFNNNVARWKEDIVFTTNKGLYIYNRESERFMEHGRLNEIFGRELNVRRLFENEDLTWFVHGDEVGYFRTSEENPVLKMGLFLEVKGQFIQSMEVLVPLNHNRSVLVGTNFGLYVFDLEAHNRTQVVDTQFSSIQYTPDDGSVVPVKLELNASAVQLPARARNLVFTFSAPGLQRKRNVQYSTWLEGADSKWSEWQSNAYKELNLLRPGNYSFHVKARSLLGETANEAVYHFEVLPAWYQTRLAYLAYGIGSVFLIYVVFLLIRRKIRVEQEKTRAEELEKRHMLELEIEGMKLKVERDNILKDKELLEDDVVYKSKELVNYTMLMVKKQELLTELHDDLKEMKELMKNETGRQLIRSLVRKINMNLANEEHIKIFQTNFERVHEEFFIRLRSTFHDLTAKELQLCAFVRMNLTNKEIASILNISVRGVETARYRLRKRLAIAHEEDMARFLEKLYAEPKDVETEH